MRAEKELAHRLLDEAHKLGVQEARIERYRRHPCLVGFIGHRRIVVVFGGTSRDLNAFAIARQYLRREVRRISALTEQSHPELTR